MTPAITLLITDPIFESHVTGSRHPESPNRYTVILKALNELGIQILLPREATEEEILYCHTSDYLRLVKEEVARSAFNGHNTLAASDVRISSLSFTVALRAVGAVETGIDAVMKRQAQNVFCLVRPPGHHACSNMGGGFCIFNNVAIGARYAAKNYNVKRTVIVDLDVHHGNGTQEIFYEDSSVFYFSTHQSPHYPETGKPEETGSGKGEGTTMNCPIAAGENSRDEVIGAFKNKLVPAMAKFKPELVIISCGFDAHAGDPLGGFNLTDQDFSVLTDIVKQIAKTYAHGRIVSVLEGGYNLDVIGSAAKAHVAALMKA